MLAEVGVAALLALVIAEWAYHSRKESKEEVKLEPILL